MKKDCWDKAEVVGKVAGGVLIPLAVAFSVYLFNSQTSERQIAAQMTQIAVGVLTQQSEDSRRTTDPLRSWAIEVLSRPGEIVPLSKAAAVQLEFSPIFSAKFFRSEFYSDPNYREFFSDRSIMRLPDREKDGSEEPHQ